jgi:ribonuclease III
MPLAGQALMAIGAPLVASMRQRRELIIMNDNSIDELERIIGYTFGNRVLLQEALTHRSFLNESQEPDVRDNERLEFFGDAVLSFFISQQLLERIPCGSEGDLTKARGALVDEKTLALIAGNMGLGRFLRMGRGEERSGGREKRSLLADAYEALVAAIYLDGGSEPLQRMLDRHFSPLFDDLARRVSLRDAKTDLQELAQAHCGSAPSYPLQGIAGPDHARIFTVAVVLGDEKIGEGSGRSKKEAEQEAAAAGLHWLRRVLAEGEQN